MKNILPIEAKIKYLEEQIIPQLKELIAGFTQLFPKTDDFNEFSKHLNQPPLEAIKKFGENLIAIIQDVFPEDNSDNKNYKLQIQKNIKISVNNLCKAMDIYIGTDPHPNKKSFAFGLLSYCYEELIKKVEAIQNNILKYDEEFLSAKVIFKKLTTLTVYSESELESKFKSLMPSAAKEQMAIINLGQQVLFLPPSSSTPEDKENIVTISLPDELLLHMAGFMDNNTLLMLRLVCKRFKKLAEDRSLPLLEKLIQKTISQLKNATLENYKKVIAEIIKQLDSFLLEEDQRESANQLLETTKSNFLKNTVTVLISSLKKANEHNYKKIIATIQKQFDYLEPNSHQRENANQQLKKAELEFKTTQIEKNIKSLDDADEDNFQEIIVQINEHLGAYELEPTQEEQIKTMLTQTKNNLIEKITNKDGCTSCILNTIGCVGASIAIIFVVINTYTNDEGEMKDDCYVYWPDDNGTCIPNINRYFADQIAQNTFFGATPGFILKIFDSCCIEPLFLKKAYDKTLQINANINQPIKISDSSLSWLVKTYKYREVLIMVTGLILFSTLFARDPLNVNIAQCSEVIEDEYGFNNTVLDKNCLNSYINDETNVIRGLTIPGGFFVAFSLYAMLSLLFTAVKKTFSCTYSLFYNDEREPLLRNNVRSNLSNARTILADIDTDSDNESDDQQQQPHPN